MKEVHLYSCLLSSIEESEKQHEDSLSKDFLSTANSSYKSVTVDCVRSVFKGLPANEQYRVRSYEHLQEELNKRNILFNPRWLASGYFMWKPVMIKEALKRIPESSFLVYHDFNINKYNEYRNNISRDPMGLVRLLNNNKCILAFRQYGKKIGLDVKSKTIREFSLNPSHDGFWGGCLVLKNNPYSRDFIAEWADLCNQDNTLPIPDHNQSNIQKGFGGHSADQALLTALIIQKMDQGLISVKTINDRDIHDRYPIKTKLIINTKLAMKNLFLK